MDTNQTIPVETAHLFPILNGLLVELLQSLSPEDWDKPTIAKKWTVKDIAAHLLDGNIRSISTLRDGYLEAKPETVDSYETLLGWLNWRNHLFTDMAKRISPPLLISLLETTGNQLAAFIPTLNPFDQAVFSVAWAGEETSLNWFHIAREYTEFFLHQQQIRHAVNKPGLITPQLFYPFIDTFMYGMPHALRHLEAPLDSRITIKVNTEAGGEWHFAQQANGWQRLKESHGQADCTVTMEPDTAWQLFSKGISPQQALPLVQITGNASFGHSVMGMVAVMA